jgi:hypothetical protein
LRPTVSPEERRTGVKAYCHGRTPKIPTPGTTERNDDVNEREEAPAATGASPDLDLGVEPKGMGNGDARDGSTSPASLLLPPWAGPPTPNLEVRHAGSPLAPC